MGVLLEIGKSTWLISPSCVSVQRTYGHLYCPTLFLMIESMKANKSSTVAKIVGLSIIGVLVAGFILPQLLR